MIIAKAIIGKDDEFVRINLSQDEGPAAVQSWRRKNNSMYYLPYQLKERTLWYTIVEFVV